MYKELFVWHQKLDGLDLATPWGEKRKRLEREFGKEEVLSAISMNGDKALGPSGFSIAFF